MDLPSPAAATAATDATESRGVGMEPHHVFWNDDESDTTHHCSTSKRYVPSNYEQTHFQKAAELATVSDFDERMDHLLTFLSSPREVRRATGMHLLHIAMSCMRHYTLHTAMHITAHHITSHHSTIPAHTILDHAT
jgi:hypothetical protein